jgi:asparagine synthase (glutamine-hydrolysing)
VCGIAGKLNFDPGRRVDRATLLRMTSALIHRGPDDEGVESFGPVGFGHRRLSIIDLSPAGHQPMANDDGSVWIVFNGEIYNFQELRRGLEQAGWRFRSNSDTEVLLRLYEALGVGCLHQLRGMFAFAIWDVKRQSLFIARDRLGVKPLFYRVGPDGLSFASELKALLQDPEVERRVDPVAIHHYLTYQYVPSPHCAFKGINKLRPAHYLLCHEGRVEVRPYWKLAHRPKHEVGSPRQLERLGEELRHRLEDAVRCRLVSDVPLGAFLSGGIDSSAVVGMMSGLSNRPVKTFSIGFEEQSYDELPAARVVADRFGTDHTEFRVRADIVDLLPTLVRAYDEPYADASAIPTFILSRLARRHVTVALTGDGGDENFAGYDRYRANDLARRLGGVAGLLGHPLARSVVQAIPHGNGQHDLRWRLKRFVDRLGQSREDRNAAWLSQFDGAEKEQLYAAGFQRQVSAIDSREVLFARSREADAEDFLDTTLYSDITTYLPDCLLVKADIASMANALEARSPFLDHPLMEFAARIPNRFKLRRGETKWILKRALRGLLPDAILHRPKMGFNLPLDAWLRGELREPARELLLGARSRGRGYFNPAYVRRLLDEHDAGRWNWHSEIWTLMMLEMWHREFVDGVPAAVGALVA